jgi:aspartate racemase
VKHIGIVACSAEGAALCYQTICREALAVVGKNDHPRITMDSIAMARWMPAFDAGDYAGVARVMLESARLLASAGADFAICPDNSAHLAWDHVQAETPIPWLHIARVVAEEARRCGFRRVGSSARASRWAARPSRFPRRPARRGRSELARRLDDPAARPPRGISPADPRLDASDPRSQSPPPRASEARDRARP